MNSILPPLDNVDACIAFAHKINPKRQPLTIEKLRSFPGCAHYSDEEAAGIIQSFEQLTAIVFEAITYGQNLCSSKQQIVFLKSTYNSNKPTNCTWIKSFDNMFCMHCKLIDMYKLICKP